jgi:hypothetical protein
MTSTRRRSRWPVAVSFALVVTAGALLLMHLSGYLLVANESVVPLWVISGCLLVVAVAIRIRPYRQGYPTAFGVLLGLLGTAVGLGTVGPVFALLWNSGVYSIAPTAVPDCHLVKLSEHVRRGEHDITTFRATGPWSLAKVIDRSRVTDEPESRPVLDHNELACSLASGTEPDH